MTARTNIPHPTIAEQEATGAIGWADDPAPAQARIIPHGTTGAIIVSAVPVTLPDWQRAFIARSMHADVSAACVERLAGVLVVTR